MYAYQWPAVVALPIPALPDWLVCSMLLLTCDAVMLTMLW